MQMQSRDKKPRQDEVSDNRNQTIREMKPDKTAEHSPFGEARPLDPCPAFMPCKIVENSDFNRDKRRGAIIQSKTAFEDRERNELNANSDDADGVELQP